MSLKESNLIRIEIIWMITKARLRYLDWMMRVKVIWQMKKMLLDDVIDDLRKIWLRSFQEVSGRVDVKSNLEL